MAEKSTKKTYIIIDGYSLVFRAYFGTQFLSTSDGRPTNAIFGFTNMLLSLLDNEQPYGIVVAFDAPGKTFRHADFPEYKAHRKETDTALIQQIPLVHDLVEALGVDREELAGFEADDLVGTIAKRVEKAGMHALIVTGDNDQLQLVTQDTTVRYTVRGITDVVDYTPEKVFEKFGFGPEMVPDYKALRGDPSDNIPGIAGIGEKTATALLQEFGHVENLVEHLDKVNPKIRAKLEADLDLITTGKKLTTIVCDAPLSYDLKPYRVDLEGMERARSFLQSLEFRTLQNRIDKILPKFSDGLFTEAVAVAEQPTVEATDAQTADEVRSAFSKKAIVAISCDAEGVCLAAGELVWRVPVALAGSLQWLSEKRCIVHDGRNTIKALRAHNLPDVPLVFDSQLAAFVLSPGRGHYDLRAACREHLEREPGADAASMAACLFALYQPMTDRMKAEGTLHAFAEVDLPLLPILMKMEDRGILLDTGYLHDFSVTLKRDIETLAGEIHELAGETFTIGSPKQLGYILFEKLGLTAGKKTKTGYSTDVDVLTALAAENEIAAKVLSWRELTKLKSTYADSLPTMVGADGRVHTTYNLTGAATGRLSSTDPNLQNIPTRTELGREIRRAFIAPEGRILLSLDYSQIELRLLAHMCEDPRLLEAFDKGEDIHRATAESLFGTPGPNVTSDQRRIAKMVNYAVLYGMSDFGLAQSLGMGVGEAKAIIEAYFAKFPRVKDFTTSIIEEARTKGFTTTLIGRRRYFPDIHTANRQMRMAAERAAINAPMQGTAADVIKIAMINLNQSGLLNGTQMLLQVHDELVFECDKGKAGVAKDIASIMSKAMELRVPLDVDTKSGTNWRDMS